MATGDDCQGVDECPAKLFKLVCVESFLQTKHENYHSDSHQAKAHQAVVVEENAVDGSRFVEDKTWLSNDVISAPGFEDAEKLEHSVEVPFNPLGLNLNVDFFVTSRL